MAKKFTEKKFLEQITKSLPDITSRQLSESLDIAHQSNEFLVQVLIERFPKHMQAIIEIYAKMFDTRVANIDDMTLPAQIIGLISRDVARRFHVLPIDRIGNNMVIAVLNPHDIATLDKIRFQTGYTPHPVFAVKKSLTAAINHYYKMQNIGISKITANKSKTTKQHRDVIKAQAGDPIVKLVNEVLMQCVLRGASDIHIEPYETYMRIRLRIDGALIEIARPPISYKAQIVSRLKIMARIDIAEKRKPQDGAIQVTIDGRPIDFRVNSLPTVHGEKIVLRILDKSSLEVDLTNLGFELSDLKRFNQAIHQPYGMVLVTGPTGSGKTTTLYSALKELNKISENIITAEDPVEYNLEGINQVAIDEKIDLSFASALRAFLRQDPDIIMVGEIRDRITGEIAIKAALTGHLVLSTLHTNSAPDSITRLLDMGLEPFNLISSINAIVAQRLVRKLCKHCKTIDSSITPQALTALGVENTQSANAEQIYRAVGCARCSQSGYSGRTAVHEVLIISDTIRNAIMNQSSSLQLKEIAQAEGMRTLRQNALLKMQRGITDSLEVIKNTNSDSSHSAEEAS